MYRPTFLLILLLCSKIGFTQSKFEALVNNCRYDEAFEEISKQPYTPENKYNHALLLMQFGAMELSKIECYQVIQQSKDPILLAKSYQLLFDISYYLTDVEAERNYADSSYYYYKKLYGEKSIYKAQYNINLTRYYNYFRRNDLSKALSIEALDITRRFKKESFKIDLPMVYSQYYASFRNDPKRENYDSAQIYCDSALFWHKVMYSGSENFSKIKLYHLKGLVYLDRNTMMTSLGKWGEGKKYLAFAKQNFEKANNIITKNIGNQHVLLSYSNALIGLLYLQQLDYPNAIKYFDSAKENLYPNPYLEQYITSSTMSMMGIYDWQNNCFYSQYYDTGNLNFLKQAINTSRKAEVIYEVWIKEGKSLNDYYNHIPYQKLSALYYEYFKKTNTQLYLDSSYYYAEKEKIAELINKKANSSNHKRILNSEQISQEKIFVDKEILRDNNYIGELEFIKKIPNKPYKDDPFKNILSVKELQKLIKDDSTAIILYSHYNAPVRFDPTIVAHVVTKKEYNHLSFELKNAHPIKDTIDLFMQSLLSNDQKTFMQASYCLYNAFFKPIEAIVPHNARKLLICPVNRFRNFPFDVLISHSEWKIHFSDQPYLIEKICHFLPHFSFIYI
jgi:hypothetical protein